MSEHELHKLVLKYKDAIMQMPLALKGDLKIPPHLQEAMAQGLTQY